MPEILFLKDLLTNCKICKRSEFSGPGGVHDNLPREHCLLRQSNIKYISAVKFNFMDLLFITHK